MFYRPKSSLQKESDFITENFMNNYGFGIVHTHNDVSVHRNKVE